jgi:hypothetical protein
MPDGWYGSEWVRRRYGMQVPGMGVAVPGGAIETSGYGEYVGALESLRPGAGRVHQAVVEEVRKCAMQARSIANPTQRMVAQVQCAKNISSVMGSKGFVAYSKKKRSKKKYAPIGF